jgi:DNA-binding transcriptional LysR family regulator
MNSLQIRNFLAIVDSGLNFAAAANRLFVSQPTLTEHIRNLGEELGAPLFNTSNKRHIRLTAAGEIYYEAFSQMRDILDTASKKASALKDTAGGTLRIALFEYWNPEPFEKLIEQFCADYPDIKVEIFGARFAEIDAGIVSGEYDIAFTIKGHLSKHPQIAEKNFMPFNVVLRLSENNPLAAQPRLHLADFRDEPLYLTRQEYIKGVFEKAIELCKDCGFVPKVQTLPNFSSITLALKKGSGWTITDSLILPDELPGFRHIRLPSVEESYAVAAWKEANRNGALLDFLVFMTVSFNRSPPIIPT